MTIYRAIHQIASDLEAIDLECGARIVIPDENELRRSHIYLTLAYKDADGFDLATADEANWPKIDAVLARHGIPAPADGMSESDAWGNVYSSYMWVNDAADDD